SSEGACSSAVSQPSWSVSVSQRAASVIVGCPAAASGAKPSPRATTPAHPISAPQRGGRRGTIPPTASIVLSTSSQLLPQPEEAHLHVPAVPQRALVDVEQEALRADEGHREQQTGEREGGTAVVRDRLHGEGDLEDVAHEHESEHLREHDGDEDPAEQEQQHLHARTAPPA